MDEFFDFRFGKLPYRSLEFKHETLDVAVHQPAPVVNYPNDFLYTRVTEFKYLTGQTHAKTAVVYEYPRAEGDPYYPVPRPENAELYQKYKARPTPRRACTSSGCCRLRTTTWLRWLPGPETFKNISAKD